MIPFRLLINAGAMFMIGGLFLVLYSTSQTAVEIIVKFRRRTWATWVGRRLQAMGIVEETPFQADRKLHWDRFAMIVAIPLLAVAVRDWMLSPLVGIIGILVLTWGNFQHKQVERAQINEDAETIALQIRALIRVDHSLVNALEQVKLPTGIMKSAIEQTARRLRMHQPPDLAARALTGLPGKVTSRLAALIAQNAHLTDDIQEALLLSLEQETHRQKLQRSKTRQTLALVRGTIRLLQGVVAASLGFVMLAPAWRDFFLQDFSHRTLLAVLLVGVVLASLYFEFEVHQLSYGEI